MPPASTIRTERLEIRPAAESDRRRFVDLFMHPDFMVFTATGPLEREAANARFDHMRAFTGEASFGKQAIVEISTAALVGYVGADEFEFRGQSRLEFGYRLVEEARGIGYATEASQAVLEVARTEWKGELLALINPHNRASRKVILKVGFELVEPIVLEGDSVDLYRLLI